jgi:kynurenine formamidase
VKAQLQIQGKGFHLDLHKPHDISLPIHETGARAWYVEPLKIEPVRTDEFIGEVRSGGSVNFRNIFFNPHAHGTHTECLGHITPEIYSVSEQVRTFMHLAQLISISPENIEEDWVILPAHIPDKCIFSEIQSLIIRTTPNSPEKKSRNYSNTNPPYISAEAMQKIVDLGIRHLLIDQPSVDREVDGGALRAHRIFWGVPHNPRWDCSITEMIYVADNIPDGCYLLNLSFPAFINDASPSRPLLFELHKATEK